MIAHVFFSENGRKIDKKNKVLSSVLKSRDLSHLYGTMTLDMPLKVFLLQTLQDKEISENF